MMLTDEEKRKIQEAALIGIGVHECSANLIVDNHHTREYPGGKIVYEWWVIDRCRKVHVIFETSDIEEYRTKDREGHDYIRQWGGG